MNLEKLNAQCAIEELQFVEGPGGLIMAEVSNDHAKARISTYSGQVLSFQPHGEEDLLFVSELAFYQPGKAIKGGMPVCWPWFGPDPEGKSRPRTRLRANGPMGSTPDTTNGKWSYPPTTGNYRK